MNGVEFNKKNLFDLIDALVLPGARFSAKQVSAVLQEVTSNPDISAQAVMSLTCDVLIALSTANDIHDNQMPSFGEGYVNSFEKERDEIILRIRTLLGDGGPRCADFDR